MLFKILGILFALFVVLFVAITVEESFFGGRRRRRLQQKARRETGAESPEKKEPEADGERPASNPRRGCDHP